MTGMGGLTDYLVRADASVFVRLFLLLLSLYALVTLLLYRSRLRPGRLAARGPSPFVRAISAFLVAVSFFLLLELSLALAWREAYNTPFGPDPVLLWAPRPGFSGVFPASDLIPFSINSLGYRGYEPAKRGSPERLLVVGDSFTFGLKVRDCETYSFLLGGELSRRHPYRDLEVVNGGVPGYSSFQEYHRLRRSLSMFHPRLVVVAFPVNDVRMAPRPERELTTFNPLFYTVMERMVPMRTYLAVRELFEDDLRRKAGGGPLSSHERVTVEEHGQNMQRIVALARRSGAKVFFVSLPHLENTEGQRKFRSAFLAAAAKLGVPALDLYRRWLETKSEAQLEKLFVKGPKNRHPNSEGHREIAAELAEFLDAESGGH